MLLYKGAAEGTHWYVHDPRLIRGFSSSPGITNAAAIASHITSFSHPSPYLSFSASPAIARRYALPRGGTKGRIYEIDTTVTSLTLIDPVQEIAAAFGPLGRAHMATPLWGTHHTGDADLVAALTLGYPPADPVYGRRGSSLPPTYSIYLRAVTFALAMQRSYLSVTQRALASSMLGM